MIQPEKIPQFTGDLEQLESDHADLKKDAGHIRGAGGDIHSRFQGLSAYYTAPEAEQLFATTKPVKDRADGFADELETVSGALSSYATEVRPLVSRLKELKAKAHTFVESVKDDDEWEYDEDKVGEHNRLREDITATVAAFWAAERTCHNKITALWGGAQMVAGDGSEKDNQYGFNAEDLKNAKLPWGDPVEEKHYWYEVGHWVKSFVWDGLIVDGVWGTIKGLGTLVGFGGWEAMGQAWKGLAQLATGLALSSIPGVATAFWALPDDKLPSWIRDSRTAMKETGKALVAWDEWGKNPARAAGAVTFNVVTTVFTGGAGAAASGAGKAGAVAKALSVAGKAGRVIDPMTYIAKGAGAGLSKIGDITKGLRGVGNIDIPTLPDGSVHLPDGHQLTPNGDLVAPDGSIGAPPASHGADSMVPYGSTGPGIPHSTTPTLPAHWTTQGSPTPSYAGVHAGTDGVTPILGNTAGGAHYNTPPTAPIHAPGGAFDPAPAPSAYDHAQSYDHASSPSSYDTSPATAPHPGGPGPGLPYGPGHDFPGAGHTDDASHAAGHGDADAWHHGDDAAHAGDHADAGDGATDAAAPHGSEGPVPPAGHGTDVPGGAAGEPFAYTPLMSAEDFADLATDAERHAVATAELERGTNPYPSTSNRAGQEYGDAYWNDHLDNLDPKARDALERYSSFYYRSINGQLRNVDVPLERPVADLVDNMDRVMGSRPVPENIMVVRGTDVSYLNLRSPLEMQGNVYDELGYMSTSLGRDPAFSYQPVHLHMRVPQGTPALWIDHISVNKGERELLLARGVEYKVTRVFQDEAGKWQVYCEVVPKARP
ncbi:ADP-ribosyltransferase [Streptomyces sp. NPDC057382]|uniref:ADP-ribosyltransferase n=3 Tax=unclassified Streptomyces TaxID=2593676 RepID=UPI00362F273F